MPNSNKKWYGRWWGILLLFFLAIFLAFFLATGIYIFQTVRAIGAGHIVNPNSIKIGSSTNAQVYNIDTTGNYTLGAKKPKVTIIEFADYACPYSKAAEPKIRAIVLKHMNEVQLVYKDFAWVSENSPELAMSARCAGDQGAFWEMHDQLFANQGITTEKEVLDLAQKIGLDVMKLGDCLNKAKYMNQVKKDIVAGDDAGVQGTPTWFINGYRVTGDLPEGMLETLIEKLLK